MQEALTEALAKHGAEIKQVSGILVSRGWAESNGGNLSIRMEEPWDPTGEEMELRVHRPELNGVSLLLTIAGSRMRDVAAKPHDNLCLVKVTEGGTKCVVESTGGKVTSEFPSHLATHGTLVATRPEHKAFLHTHPTYLMALSHLIMAKSEIPKILERMFPEAALALADNLKVLPYIMAGSEGLGKATANAFQEVCGVIWSGHGMVASGKDLSSALDLIETAEKAAQIAILLGPKMYSTGLSADHVRAIWEKFKS
ncbi:rhamnulose-1-phosphate aldolase [candidate division WOR-3 bacterium]|uniref:Rhamnulose-1-phosphate aldolase n=1 Tax=candidate division WOR-3 bacterium TaxID=2052148 RepID=A0A9D5QE62_UNCW3|nr:rhamnulose-1-phosphate aldolase [candidate division WOR-3 bacterium]MBD3364740.1 rhamnulose-1-phosphate aldolase [candidate division WOR-3 bacterium]